MKITSAPAGSWIENRYSTVDPFSKDNKYLLLIAQHHFEMWTGDGHWLKSLPLSADSEPCWSRQDPHILYYRWNNEVREFDVRTEVSVTLRKFPAPISGRGESDISEDGERLVLADTANRIWIYNVLTDDLRVGDIWPEPFNALYILPDNEVLVCAYTGVYLLSDGRKIAPSLQHNAVTRDVDGEPILVRFNGDDIPGGGCANGIEKVRIRDGKPTCIWPIGWMPQERGGGPASFAGHLSSPGGLPWVLASLYSPFNAEPSRIYKVWKDGSRQEFVCETGSVMMRDGERMAYNPTPRASVSRDGSRIVFNSNFGDTSRGPNYCDVAHMKLAETEKPDPSPEQPIDIPPDTSEAAALRHTITIMASRHEELENQLRAARTDLTGAITERDRERERLEAMAEQLQAKQRDAARLVMELADARQPRQEQRVRFKPEELKRHWDYGVLSSLEHVAMYDVDPDTGELKRVDHPDLIGNDYRFHGVPGPDGKLAFEMWLPETNKNPWR